jgi:Fe-S-cluster containining protein
MIKLFEKEFDNIKHNLETLRGVYEEIPKTVCSCSDIGICCTVTEKDINNVVNIYPIEYLNILHYLAKRIKGLKPYLIKLKTLAFLNITMENIYRRKRRGFKKDAKRQICIFRDEKKKGCRIYQARPLDCRLFGLRQMVIRKGKIIRPTDCIGLKLLNKGGIKDWNKEKIKNLYKRVKESSYNVHTERYNPIYPEVYAGLEFYFLSDFVSRQNAKGRQNAKWTGGLGKSGYFTQISTDEKLRD